MFVKHDGEEKKKTRWRRRETCAISAERAKPSAKTSTSFGMFWNLKKTMAGLITLGVCHLLLESDFPKKRASSLGMSHANQASQGKAWRGRLMRMRWTWRRPHPEWQTRRAVELLMPCPYVCLHRADNEITLLCLWGKLATFVPFWIVRHSLAASVKLCWPICRGTAYLDKSATIADVGRFVTQADAEEQKGKDGEVTVSVCHQQINQSGSASARRLLFSPD